MGKRVYMCIIWGDWENVGLRSHICTKGWGPIGGTSRIYGGVGKKKNNGNYEVQ
jgi:hypothetical protein